MNIRRLIHIFIAFACLAMMSACYNYDQEEIEEVNAGNYYINLAISVSSGNEHSTRAYYIKMEQASIRLQIRHSIWYAISP